MNSFPERSIEDYFKVVQSASLIVTYLTSNSIGS